MAPLSVLPRDLQENLSGSIRSRKQKKWKPWPPSNQACHGVFYKITGKLLLPLLHVTIHQVSLVIVTKEICSAMA